MLNRHSSYSFVLLTLLVGPLPAAGQVSDSWSPKVALRDDVTSDFLAPIHASLMPDGSVMLFGFTQTLEEPPNVSFQTGSFTALLVPPVLGSSVPSEMYITNYPEDLEYNLNGGGGTYLHDTYFCSGHSHMQDGTLFISGGLRNALDWPDPALGTTISGGGGMPYAATWDHTAKTWSRIPNDMVGQGSSGPVGTFFEGPDRYYPTVTRLADGRMLVVGGSQILELTIVGVTYISNEKNLSAEIYDPETGDWTELATHATSPPAIFNRDYTHSFVLPASQGSFDILILGEFGFPVLMSTTGPQRWSALGPKRPGPDMNEEGIPPVSGASTVMLPIRLQANEWGYSNGSILVAGGEGDYKDEVDIYDPATGTWDAGLLLAVDRHHLSSLLLPNGEVLVVSGHNGSTATSLLRQAEYIDPAAGFARRTGSDSSYVVRGYHTITLLLPDGRVLVGGGRLGGPGTPPPEKANFELLSPPYMFNARPTILSAPSEIYYGQPFQASWSGSVDDAVLVALGSMTHSIDMAQRHVQVSLTPDPSKRPLPGGKNALDGSIEAPADSSIAPPGYYMLFLLAPDSMRTPSVAKIVHLQHAQNTSVSTIPDGSRHSGLALTLSPNPTRGHVLVQLSGRIGGVAGIRVIDVRGRVVRRWGPRENLDLDLSGLPAGVYFIRVRDTAGRSVSGTVTLVR